MSSGGSICGIRQVGQANSVSPGATVKIMRQPAQRTRTPPSEGCDGGAVGGGGGGRGRGGDGTDGWVIFFVPFERESAKGNGTFFVILVNSVNFFLLLVFLCVWCPSLGNEPNGMVCRVDGVCEIED